MFAKLTTAAAVCFAVAIVAFAATVWLPLVRAILGPLAVGLTFTVVAWLLAGAAVGAAEHGDDRT